MLYRKFINSLPSGVLKNLWIASVHLNRSNGITHPAVLQIFEVYGKQQLNLPSSFSKIHLKLLCWFDTTRNFHVDDVVVCKDLPTQQPGRFPLARVTEIHPGSDGKVRVVTVSTGF